MRSRSPAGVVPLRRLAVGLLGGSLLLSAMSPAVFAAATVVTPGMDYIDTAEDTPISGNVLTNDTSDGGTLTVAGFTPIAGTYGTLTIATNGDYLYTPKANWSGNTTTTYHASANGTLALGYILITVSAVNDAPVASDQAVATSVDEAKEISLAATDAEGSALSFAIVDDPAHGTLTGTAPGVTYHPADGYRGPDSFTFRANDGDLDSNTATVTITVNAVPVANADSVATDEDTPLPITLTGSDADGGELAYAIVDQPGHGDVDCTGADCTYAPDENYHGSDQFTFKVNDGIIDSSTAAVDITVTSIPDAPVATDDSATVAQASAAAQYDVLANDEDGDGDALTITGVDVDAAQGTATIVANKIRFMPAPAFTGDAVITYTVSDGALTDTGTLTVHVIVDDAAPVVATPTVGFGTAARVDQTAPLRIAWSATDAGVGVKTYEVEVRVGSGTFVHLYSGTATSITRAYGFGTSLAWRVRATDNNANVSGWVTSATRSIAAYQGGAPVKFTGTWRSVKTNAASGSGYKYTTSYGKKASLAFSGMAVMYVAPKTAKGGYVKVSIDGAGASRRNLRASTTHQGQIIKTVNWTKAGSHAIWVKNNQSGRRAMVDAFLVLK